MLGIFDMEAWWESLVRIHDRDALWGFVVGKHDGDALWSFSFEGMLAVTSHV